MKRNRERKYIWNFLKAAVVIGVALALLMPGSAAFANYGKTAKVQASVNTVVAATTIFTIENPPVDFEVVDADPFDGFGDNGPYSTFNDALLGTFGECRSMAEFDISPFSVPPGEFISVATFEVKITEIDVFGLGVDGETPESLAVDGYVGNGLEELSDFEAGDGNVLDSVDTPDPQIGQVLSFDVTSFVTDLVNSQEQYVGLTIRAETFGGLWVTEGGVFPKLTIETIPEPEPDLDCSGTLSWTEVSPGEIVAGQFLVANIGDSTSTLSWNIESYPSWGVWSFTPSSGSGLTPEMGAITVGVEVTAPDQQNQQFTGEIKIVNTEDSNDFDTISVSLKTPVSIPQNKLLIDSWFLSILERFPHAFPILRQMLGY
ncbi:MAG: hypothetical protein IMZ53_11600 [Thermoplasmata archaeon]|nr:hypothetical protein [Thermoplasmata archaeon]MBE3141208.1 hypothetical protein [Thermoplasmata archaeon]